ncbi:acyltransferase family protein [Belnapia moabensis]|uniref:acyltransferase family protein n=1 Tax=Belnapia moabensis TaxID=365533 RepID=UPI000693ED1F|nr:acyltransferase [Belnapia moabensis]
MLHHAKAHALHPAERLPCLDGWRGVSILVLLFGHFTPLPWINMGRVGVELFFVLSGRLMADILFVQKAELGPFFRRRIARVWPALAVFVAVIALNPLGLEAWRLDAFDIAATLTFWVNYGNLYKNVATVFDHVWSLSVEEHSYVLLAGLALAARRWSLNVPMLLGALAVAAVANGALQTLIGGLHYFQVYWRTDVRIASILMAGAVYLRVREAGLVLPGWWGAAPLALGLLGLALNVQAAPDWLKYSAGTACFALAVAIFDRGHPLLARLIEHPVLQRFGLWSFSLYVWQQAFYVLKDDMPRSLDARLALLAGAVACGLISFYVVEQPCRRFLNRYWGRLRRFPAALPTRA